jgi:hypothetical protein
MASLGCCRGMLPFRLGQGEAQRVLAGGILGGDVEQLLYGVPDDVVRCTKVQWLLRVVHAAPGLLWPQSLRTTTVSFLVAMSTPACVPRAAFGLHTHVPLVSLMVCLGFRTWALLPQWFLG